METKNLPVREFRCRLDELGPLNQMVRAMFDTNKNDFGLASSDFADASYLTGWDGKAVIFEKLVPTTTRRATDKLVTEAMTKVARGLRAPLDLLNIRINRADKDKALTVAAEAFGLGKVRSEITTHDMEGLDGALKNLMQLILEPSNLAVLTAKGHTAADTAALTTARQQIADFNTAQNENQNAGLELNEENIKAGNALWEYISDVLETGWLYYKETKPKKARTFRLATLMKRIRQEHGGQGGAAPEPGV